VPSSHHTYSPTLATPHFTVSTMRLRMQHLPPLETVPIDSLARLGPAGGQPTREARPTSFMGFQRRIRSIASCFRPSTQANISPGITRPAALSQQTLMMLHAAIDRWGRTQTSMDITGVCSKIKRAFHVDVSRSRTAARLYGATKTLSLETLELTSIPAEISQLPALQKLGLAKNHLSVLPAEIYQTKGLQQLDLFENYLENLPAEVGQASALQTLLLGKNRLHNLPEEIGELTSLRTLDVSNNQLDSLPPKIGQLTSLIQLDLDKNRLNSLPAEMGQLASLRLLRLNSNQLNSVPAEICQLTSLSQLELSNNQLDRLPIEMGQLKALIQLRLLGNRINDLPAEIGQLTSLQQFNLGGNRLNSLPAEIGQAKALKMLFLQHNRLSTLPVEIAQLSNLRFLDLSTNEFTSVPRALLELPAITEINLLHNPLPDEEIIAIRDVIAGRLAASQSVPQLILPPLAAEAGELREAVANGMNVHTSMLTNAFKKMLDEVAEQFPECLSGSIEAQRTEMAEIAQRLTGALNNYAQHPALDPQILSKAHAIADVMFQKGQGMQEAYFNEFQYSPGHVLAYTFLAIEAQVARTPEAHRAEAQANGMARLVTALESGSGFCDTRLCEEVMQTLGMPFSIYAEEHPEIVKTSLPPLPDDECYDTTFKAAKQVLQALLDDNPELATDAPPAAWEQRLIQTMERDHPRVPVEQIQKCVQTIQTTWQMFHELVVEQRTAGR